MIRTASRGDMRRHDKEYSLCRYWTVNGRVAKFEEAIIRTTARNEGSLYQFSGRDYIGADRPLRE